MLGRLLHTAASSLNPNSYTSRNPATLESVTEEEHTRSLLFPDSSLLQHSHGHAYPLSSPPSSSSISGFDDHGGLELDITKDFRIIIAQDAAGFQDPCVLFDTQSTTPPAPTQGLGFDSKTFEPSQSKGVKQPGSSGAGSITHPPRHIPSGSTGGPSRLPQRPLNPINAGAFCRPRPRSSTLSGAAIEAEASQNRADLDAKEETSTLLNCMFGSAAFSYKGPSTKMHVLSLDGGFTGGSTVTSPIIGRDIDYFTPTEVRKRNPLSRANTTSPIMTDSKTELKGPTKGTILLTRTFAVNLPEGGETVDETRDLETAGSFSQPESNSFPFPETSNSPSGLKPKKMKEKKTPIYALGIILQLPVGSKTVSRPPSRHHSMSFAKPGFSIPSSFDSQRSDWTFLDSPSGIFSPTYSTSGTLDDRIDLLVDHWDVMTRTLSYLEKVAGKEILSLLKRADVLTPAPSAPAVAQPVKDKSMQKINQRFVRLAANALYDVAELRRKVIIAAQRISLAVRIPRVITGQGRWGIWREEARWVGRWAGGREQNFFFFNLLTSFLGNHTEWLNSLGPSWYKRRHLRMLQKAHQDAEPTISHRTVIVATDKMAARRLVFLLSAFLPSKTKPESVGSPLRPGTSMSRRGYSPSPPTNSLAREESLRRTVNRRALDHRLNLDASRAHERSISLTSVDSPTEALDRLETLERVPTDQSRRDSDVRSIKTASLPIPSNDISTRKSSAVTTSTVTPIKTTPVAHFAGHSSRPVLNSGLRTESSESIASANLLQTLKRSGSTNISSESADSQSGSRWGSLISGFWSNRQDSMDGSEFTTPPALRSVKSNTSPQSTVASRRSQSKLESMAEEAVRAGQQKQAYDLSERSNSISIPKDASDGPPTKSMTESPEVHFASAESSKRDPIKLQVDENDGVIDVDIPLPNFLSTSIESAINSPGREYHQSVASLDGLASLHSHASGANHSHRDQPDGSLNVAGWLNNYHEDFSLQAVPPYAKLEEEIKESMRAEASPVLPATTPTGEDGPHEKWIEVCSTLICDTRTFSIKRLRLRRRIKLDLPQPPLLDPESRSSSLIESQLGSLLAASAMKRNSAESTIEESFIEETVMDLDGTLVDAVERVLARSGQSSKAHSRASSPTGRGRGRLIESRQSDTASNSGLPAMPSLEIPRAECKKMVVGALEQVVRSVTAERLREEGRGSEVRLGPDFSFTSSKTKAEDNTLREGIRKWLQEVEEAE